MYRVSKSWSIIYQYFLDNIYVTVNADYHGLFMAQFQARIFQDQNYVQADYFTKTLNNLCIPEY